MFTITGPEMLVDLAVLLAAFLLTDLFAYFHGSTLSQWVIATSRKNRRFAWCVLGILVFAAAFLTVHFELPEILFGGH